VRKTAHVQTAPDDPTAAGLFFQSLFVILTNLIPFYGVMRLGWDSFALIVLYIAEGIVVFLTDLLKSAWVVKSYSEKRTILTFELVFICFFGFFAILVFGRDPDSSDLIETIHTAFRGLAMISLGPILIMVAMRLLRTAHEVFEARYRSGGEGRSLHFSGGGWMLLLFLLVMLAPFIADETPNPRGGLMAVVALKTLGDLIGLWLERKGETAA
jgi:hypothetical protein